MRTLLKIGKYVLISVIAFLVIVVAAFLSIRAYNQHANQKVYAIKSANGINEGSYVKIGGIEQWVQIRGQDRDNPVLLCVHGGPGGSWLAVTRLFFPWEKNFTVVLWDQRGAGKTLKATGATIATTMSVDRMAQDGIEVAEYLRTHLHKDKIFVLGHSWGSILGVNMAKRRPDLFYAYVGTGQVSDLPRSIALDYARLLEQARTAKDPEILRSLTAIGPPPYTNLNQVAGFFKGIGAFQPASDQRAMREMGRSLLSPPPNYGLRDVYSANQGFMAVPTWRLYNEMLTTKLTDLGPDFGVPVFIFQGTEDNVTPIALAEEYFKAINAPHKEWVRLEGGGHFAVWSMADQFSKELVTRVRPLASKP